MFARTLLCAARQRAQPQHPFSRFFQMLLPQLRKTSPRLRMRHGNERMALAGMLWRATRPAYGTRNSAQRTQAACRLYKRYGNALLRSVRARTGGSSRRRRTTAAAQRAGAAVASARTASAQPHRNRNAPRRTPTRTTTAAATPRRLTLTAFVTAVRQSRAHARATAMTSAQRQQLLRVLYDGTAAEARAQRRIATARRVLHCIAQQQQQQQQRTRAQRPMTATAASASRPFDAFARAVRVRAGVRAGASHTAYLRRMWRVLSRQRQLTHTQRVQAAARLLSRLRDARPHTRTRAVASPARKSSAHTTSTTTATTKTPAAAAKAAAKAATTPTPVTRSASASARRKTMAMTTTRRRRRNHFLRFYRAMVLTGDIPNYPQGARSRTIKLLWKRVHDRKSLHSRIQQARRLLANAAATARATTTTSTTPSSTATTATTTAAAAPKSTAMTASSHRAAARIRARAAHVSTRSQPQQRRPRRQQHVAAAPRPPVMRFVVPANYNASPFAATYAALSRFMTNKTPDARMRAIARAWTRTEVPGPDTRSPHDRIQAVANALRHK